MFKRMSGSRSTWKNVAAATLLVAIMLASTVLGAGAQEGISSDRPYEPTAADLAKFSAFVVVSQEIVSVQAAPEAGIEATWTARYGKYWKSLVGITVAKQDSYTQWSGSGSGTMYSSPRAMWQEIWSLPPTWYSGQGSRWDWYNTGYNATAQSNQWVTFTFGVPTPWGPIGSKILARNVAGFNGWGRSWRVS